MAFTDIVSSRIEGNFETQADNIISTYDAATTGTAVTTANTVTTYHTMAHPKQKIAQRLYYSNVCTMVNNSGANTEDVNVVVTYDGTNNFIASTLTIPTSGTLNINVLVELFEESDTNYRFVCRIIGLNGATPVNSFATGSIAKTALSFIRTNITNTTVADMTATFRGAVLTINR